MIFDSYKKNVKMFILNKKGILIDDKICNRKRYEWEYRA